MDVYATEDEPTFVWIDVKTILPDPNIAVLVHIEFPTENFVDIATYHSDTQQWLCCVHSIEQAVIETLEVKVTHWMPLPEPPIPF